MAQLFSKVIRNGELLCYSERGALSYIMTNWIFQDGNIDRFIKLIKRNAFNEDGFLNEIKFPNTFQKFYAATEVVFGNKEGFGSPDGLLRLEMNDNSNVVIFIEMKIDESYKKSCDKKNNSSINNQIELKMRLANKILMGEKKVIKSGDKTLKLLNAVKELIDKHISTVGKKNHDNVYFLSITKDKQNPFKYIRCKAEMKRYLPAFNKPHRVGTLWKKWQKNMCWMSSDELLKLVFQNSEV